MNKEDQIATILFAGVALVLSLAAIAISIVALCSRQSVPEKVYIKNNPYQAYCDTVGSDGEHPNATKFCNE